MGLRLLALELATQPRPRRSSVTAGAGPLVVPLSGRESYAQAAPPLVVGQVRLDPTVYDSPALTLRVVAAVGRTGITGHVKLRNITDGEDVATVDVTSTDPTVSDETLTIGGSSGDIKEGPRTYEVRIYVDAPTGEGDTIELGSASLLVA